MCVWNVLGGARGTCHEARVGRALRRMCRTGQEVYVPRVRKAFAGWNARQLGSNMISCWADCPFGKRTTRDRHADQSMELLEV